MASLIGAPVLLVAHRRRDKIRRVVDACIESGALDVTVVIDGPRTPAEVVELDAVENCVRDAPWPGAIRVHRRQANLGAGVSVAAACDYMFMRHTAAIVLEDDCVPTTEFLHRVLFFLFAVTVNGCFFIANAEEGSF